MLMGESVHSHVVPVVAMKTLPLLVTCICRFEKPSAIQQRAIIPCIKGE